MGSSVRTPKARGEANPTAAVGVKRDRGRNFSSAGTIPCYDILAFVRREMELRKTAGLSATAAKS